MIYTDDFIRLFAETNGITIKNSAIICKNVFQLMGKVIYEQNDDLAIRNVGIFKHKHFAEKKVRHPMTKEIITMPAHEVIKFKQITTKEEE